VYIYKSYINKIKNIFGYLKNNWRPFRIFSQWKRTQNLKAHSSLHPVNINNTILLRKKGDVLIYCVHIKTHVLYALYNAVNW